MVDDFENYADLNGGATAESIRAAADSPSSHATTMQALVDDLADDSQQIRTNVEGDIEDATTMNLNPASSAARRLTQSGLFAVGLLNSFADTVEIFDKEVEAINTELHNNTYARWQAQESSTGDSSEAGGSDNDNTDLSYAEIKQQEKAKLQSRYNQADTTLETEADRVAGLFEGSPDLADVKALVLAGYIPLQYAGIWPNLQLTDAERQQAQIGTVREMTAEEQANYVRNTAELPPGVADVLTPEAQQLLAADVAGDIKDREIDAATVRIMDLLKDKEPFAHAVYSQVTPNQMADAIQQMSNDVFPVGSSSMPDSDDAKVYADFLTAAGATLATYSKGDGRYAPPSDLSDQWFRAITDEKNPENAAALTMLIKHGGEQSSFDPVFLGDLTNQVYDWETSHGGDPVWGPLNEQLGQGYGIKDPSIHYGDTTDPYDNIVTYSTPFDGLANLLGGMEKTPEAAEYFFTYESDGTYVDQVGYEGTEVNEKLKYLMADRQWPTDDGDGFGVALQHATTHSRDAGDADSLTPGDRAARLASQTVFVIAKETGGGDGWFQGQPFPDSGWQIPEGMRDNVGYMLAAYAPDIQRIGAGTNEGEDGGWVWGDGDGETAYHGIMGMSANQDDLALVLQGVGRGDDKEGITAVLTAQVAHHENLMTDTLDEYNRKHPDAPKTMEQLMSDQSFRGDLFTNAETNGSALSFVLENGVEGGRDDEDARKERAEMMAKAFSIGTSFIPGAGEVLGEGASHLATGVYDAVQSEALSQLEDRIGAAPDGLSDQWGDDGEGQIREGLSYGTINALLNAGYLDSNVDPDYAVPPDAVTDPNEHGYISVDPRLYDGIEDDLPASVRNEFQDWLTGRNGQPPSEALAAALNGYASKASSWLGS
jgi:hypothetical protein